MSDVVTSSPEELRSLWREKLDSGHALLDALANPEYAHIAGIAKLEKKIRQEIKFLQKFSSENGPKQPAVLKKEHLNCSNLQNLSAIVSALVNSAHATAVLQPFNLANDDNTFGQPATKKIVVDVVSEKGLAWVKVVARNPKALDLNSSGGNQFGQRSLMDQVREFRKCAAQNRKLFRVPAIVFVFHNGVSDVLARKLTKKGVQVKGEVIRQEQVARVASDSDSESESDFSDDESIEDFETGTNDGDNDASLNTEDLTGLDTTKINLDITAMIAYVSALTNGKSDFVFKEKILTDQAEWERARPVKRDLDKLFEGKTLLCCQSAMNDFRTILGTLGGESERVRGKQLIDRLTVVEDQMTERLRDMHVSGKIKDRSRAIFGTGDSLKVVTVTANSGFVRAAKGQGVDLAVILHESRALTEDKMTNATRIQSHED